MVSPMGARVDVVALASAVEEEVMGSDAIDDSEECGRLENSRESSGAL